MPSCDDGLWLIGAGLAGGGHAGSAYTFLQLHGGSSAAALAMTVLSAATEVPSRHGWAITGSLNLSGEVGAVEGVREKVGDDASNIDAVTRIVGWGWGKALMRHCLWLRHAGGGRVPARMQGGSSFRGPAWPS